jgi:S1-C subfamily serine protease
MTDSDNTNEVTEDVESQVPEPAVSAPPQSQTSHRLAVIALVVALFSAAAAGYALNETLSANGLLGDWNYYAAPADLESLIGEAEQSIVVILCEGTGTGFAYDLEVEEPGYGSVIVTNHHVIEDCVNDPSEIEIYTYEEFEKPAEFRIRGVDEDNDLALIEIVEELPLLKASDFYAQRGWWSMAIGNPVDTDFEEPIRLDNSTTFGEISFVLNDYWNYTSATINGGNSGGPLLNNRGQVIGINTLASASTEGGVWNIAVDSDALCEELVECDE